MLYFSDCYETEFKRLTFNNYKKMGDEKIMKTIIGFFKKWREVEKNASWKGQGLGIFLFFVCWKVLEIILAIVLVIVFRGGHYNDLTSVVGIIFGFYVYYKVLLKHQKPKKQDTQNKP